MVCPGPASDLGMPMQILIVARMGNIDWAIATRKLYTASDAELEL